MLKTVSCTFHGRDIFAPAAAHFSEGFRVAEAGSVVESPVKLRIPKPETAATTIRGCVLYADGFGNLITNVPSQLAVGARRILISGVAIEGISKSYDEAGKGELLAIIGSSGFLEISVNQGSAEKRLNLEGKRGEEVLVELLF
jgi:S-adenosylmethionine hydrolase